MVAWATRNHGVGPPDSHINEPLKALWRDLPWRTKMLTRESLIELATGFVLANEQAHRKRMREPRPLSAAELRKRYPL
jgi:hypothetical protein